jgi:hypothetical protein
MTSALRTHLHGKGVVHAAAIIAAGLATLLGAIAVLLALFVGLALIATGQWPAQVAGSVIIAVAGLAVALYFRWTLK